MPVDKTELANDLATNPEYQTLATGELAKKDFVIRTKTDDVAYQERFRKDVIEKEIPGKIKEVHDQYDKDTKELFGIDRKQDEKSYDYMRRAAAEKLGGYDALKTEVNTLKEQIKKGDPTGALQKQLEETELRAKTAIEAKEKELTEYKSKYETTSKQTLLMTDYADVKKNFVKTLPALFDITERAVLDRAMANSVVKDGKLYAANADGSIKKDNAFNEVLLKDELAVQFKDVTDAQKVQSGSGSKKADGGPPVDPKTVTVETFVMPDLVKSKDDLLMYMRSSGLLQGTKLFTDIWDKCVKDHELK